MNEHDFWIAVIMQKNKNLTATKSNLPIINKGQYFLHSTRVCKIQHHFISGKFTLPKQVHWNSGNAKQAGIHDVTLNNSNTGTSNYLIPPQFYIVIDVIPGKMISNIWHEVAYFPPHIIRLKRNTINITVQEPHSRILIWCFRRRQLNQFSETTGIIIGLRPHSNHIHRQ